MLVVVALFVGCTRSEPRPAGRPPPTPSADPDDVWSWDTSSADGRLRLAQRSSATPGTCVVTCQRSDGERLWQSNAPCLAARHERRFVSLTGERVVVIAPAPDRGEDWSAARVVRLFERTAPDLVVFGASVLAAESWAKSVTWVEGCYGAAGAPPAYSADGRAVELRTIDGDALRIPLDGAAEVSLPALGSRRSAVGPR